MPVVQLVISGVAIVPNYAVNVLHHNVNFPTSAATVLQDLADFIDAWRTQCEDAFVALLPDDVEIRNYSAKVVDTGGSVTAMLGVSVPGSYVGDGMVAGVAANIGVYTADDFNEWGHIYTMGVSMSALLEGVWDAGMFTAVAALKTAMFAQIHFGTDGTADYGVWRKKTNVFHKMQALQLRPKPTLLNKRLKPVV